MKLEGKTAIVTGAAAGLGRATAIACAREGARVILADVDESTGEEAASRIRDDGGEARFVRTDVSSAADAERLVEAAREEFGGLDILINCAAVLLSPGVRVDGFPEEAWDRVIDVNLKGTYLCAKYSASLMQGTGGGVILCLISGAGTMGGSSSVAYGASKGGVRGLALVLDGQLAPLGIRVHAVSPGDMATGMKVGAIGEMAEMEGKDRADEEAHWRARLPGPERSAAMLVDLASDAGEAARGRLTIFHGDWDMETHTLKPGPERTLR